MHTQGRVESSVGASPYASYPGTNDARSPAHTNAGKGMEGVDLREVEQKLVDPSFPGRVFLARNAALSLGFRLRALSGLDKQCE